MALRSLRLGITFKASKSALRLTLKCSITMIVSVIRQSVFCFKSYQISCQSTHGKYWLIMSIFPSFELLMGMKFRRYCASHGDLQENTRLNFWSLFQGRIKKFQSRSKEQVEFNYVLKRHQVFECFLISFEQSDLFGQIQPLFVAFKELRKQTKFHADKTSSRMLKVKEQYFPPFLNLCILPQIASSTENFAYLRRC